MSGNIERSKLQQILVCLFHYVLRSKHEEILAWYNYSDNFEIKIIKIRRETGVTDKTARTQLYKKMLDIFPIMKNITLMGHVRISFRVKK